MTARKMDPRKFLPWVVIAWILCIASFLGAGLSIHHYGTVVIDLAPGVEKARYNIPVIAGSLSQALAALMLAGGFTMMHGIYAGVATTYNESRPSG